MSKVRYFKSWMRQYDTVLDCGVDMANATLKLYMLYG